MKAKILMFIAILFTISCSNSNKTADQKQALVTTTDKNKIGLKVFLGYTLGENYAETLEKTNELKLKQKIDSIKFIDAAMTKYGYETNKKIEFKSNLQTFNTIGDSIHMYDLDTKGELTFYENNLFAVSLSLIGCNGLVELFEKKYGKCHSSNIKYWNEDKTKMTSYEWMLQDVKLGIYLIWDKYSYYSNYEEREISGYKIDKAHVSYVVIPVQKIISSKIKEINFKQDQIKKQKLEQRRKEVENALLEQQI